MSEKFTYRASKNVNIVDIDILSSHVSLTCLLKLRNAHFLRGRLSHDLVAFLSLPPLLAHSSLYSSYKICSSLSQRISSLTLFYFLVIHAIKFSCYAQKLFYHFTKASPLPKGTSRPSFKVFASKSPGQLRGGLLQTMKTTNKTTQNSLFGYN